MVRDTLCRVVPEGVADDFIAHRLAKRARLTPRAAELIAAKLASHPNPIGVIEQTIANGWTGVFPEARASPAPAKRLFDLSNFGAET